MQRVRWMSAALLHASTLFAALAAVPPPSFVVNTRIDPLHRYRGAVQEVLKAHPAEYSFLPVFEHWNRTFWRHFPEAIFARTARALEAHFPENAAEMRGIAQELRDNGIPASYDYLSAWAYRHELQHADVEGVEGLPACTGIVVQAADGTVRHGRNEDLTPWLARNLTLSLSFLGPMGKPEVYGTDWYWFTTGLRTAMRPGLASLSGNFRFAAARPLETVLADIDRGVMPDMLLFRDALASVAGGGPGQTQQPSGAGGFEALLQRLSTAAVATPTYYVVAGARPGEGAVVARAPVPGANGSTVVRLGSQSIVGKPPQWALVQTNYELWETDPLDDPRRTVATNLLSAYGQGTGSSALGLYAALSTYPVHNEDTAYTTIMSAATGEFTSFVRTPMAPAPVQKQCWESCCNPESLPLGAQCTSPQKPALAASSLPLAI